MELDVIRFIHLGCQLIKDLDINICLRFGHLEVELLNPGKCDELVRLSFGKLIVNKCLDLDRLIIMQKRDERRQLPPRENREAEIEQFRLFTTSSTRTR
jgi:hypothetical protein